jgi:demethylmenaquinone methyltransferase/2-methoxy-6-polyprenyl-1,4-benzoquinol methylase
VDVVTTGYGLRNVPDLDRAIAGIARVLRPGGRFLSLDFERPEHAGWRRAYLAYLTVVGATAGTLLHGDPDTYRYIPASLARYPGAAAVAERLRAHGFASADVVPKMGGFMAIHVARR